MSYQIRYNHTSRDKSTSKAEAIRAVRKEAGVSRIHRTECADGTYCYKTAADKAADFTGERAYAVICSPSQQPE